MPAASIRASARRVGSSPPTAATTVREPWGFRIVVQSSSPRVVQRTVITARAIACRARPHRDVRHVEDRWPAVAVVGKEETAGGGRRQAIRAGGDRHRQRDAGQGGKRRRLSGEGRQRRIRWPHGVAQPLDDAEASAIAARARHREPTRGDHERVGVQRCRVVKVDAPAAGVGRETRSRSCSSGSSRPAGAPGPAGDRARRGRAATPERAWRIPPPRRVAARARARRRRSVP